MAALRALEREILSHVKANYRGFSVPISIAVSGKQTESDIWTLAFEPKRDRTPLVLVHGFAAGSALWTVNFDHLVKLRRPVYAFDLLGFGRSSRPNFSKEPEAVEREFVDSLEKWRLAMKMDEMVLLGHSLGGYVSSAYAIRYPQRVRHLVLADPWGFPTRPPNAITVDKLPLRARMLVKAISSFTPLAGLRLAGPLGPSLLARVRPDLAIKFSGAFDPVLLLKYIYHCNANEPTGELAFKALHGEMGYAKVPMLPRLLENLSQNVPVTFIYGEKSWIKPDPGFEMEKKRDHVTVWTIPHAGHHVYADEPLLFVECVADACGE